MSYTEKSPEMKEILKKMVPNPAALDQLEQDAEIKTCSWCSHEITKFKDKISEQEYRLSGLCQKCQDETFG